MQTLHKFISGDLTSREGNYSLEQIWYPSKDGTLISMFLVAPNNVEKHGENKVLLTGYGGFNASMTPTFQPNWMTWLELGGILAVPNLRGGKEYGEAWHQAGMLGNKQNVFDDFIAAAKWLILENYCSPSTLAISGRSNGGLLVGAVMVQRPELFGAVLCSVPLLDMLRYDRFSIAKNWISEYGSSEKSDQFVWLRNYSPYHNYKEKICYPPILFDCALQDSRVDPMHAMKMTAALQSLPSNTNPVLLSIKSQAGHGIGKPIEKKIDDEVDHLSFLYNMLTMKQL